MLYHKSLTIYNPASSLLLIEVPRNFRGRGVSGHGKNIVTKHDPTICGRRNANRVMEQVSMTVTVKRKSKNKSNKSTIALSFLFFILIFVLQILKPRLTVSCLIEIEINWVFLSLVSTRDTDRGWYRNGYEAAKSCVQQTEDPQQG